MKLVLLQRDVPIRPADIRQALQEIRAVEPATDPDLICLPEIFHSNYSSLDQTRLTFDSPQVQEISAVLRKNPATALAGSLAMEDSDGRSNILTVFHAGAAIPLYRKLHLFPPMREFELFRSGTHLGILDLEIPGETWRVGFAICYDLRFPELFRLLAVEGCGLIVVVAQWPARRIAAWRTLLQARAIENQIFMAGVNRCGADEDCTFGGNSLAVAPDGTILADLTDQPGILQVNLNPGRIEDSRNQFDSIRQRRHDVPLSLPHRSK
jgi:omega-amidase